MFCGIKKQNSQYQFNKDSGMVKVYQMLKASKKIGMQSFKIGSDGNLIRTGRSRMNERTTAAVEEHMARNLSIAQTFSGQQTSMNQVKRKTKVVLFFWTEVKFAENKTRLYLA